MVDGNVLVCDDSETIVESLCDTLEQLGVPEDQILRADDAEGALRLFRDKKPSLVFMDVQLDRNGGGDTVALKILKDRPRTKVIVITGMDPKDARVRALISAGAYEVLEKPLRFGRIQQLMELVDSEEKGLRRVS